jgi:DNA-binding transcriptional MerR regulator
MVTEGSTENGSSAPDGGKSATAFRTITEVATELKTPQHVLRFWETKFPQIRPVKRRGGRRYYRPKDVALLKRIRGLLYDDGYTIRGAQKLLRESGVREPHPAAGDAPPGNGLGTHGEAASDSRLRAAVEAAVRELEALRQFLSERKP